ncbi:MAG TPA: sigma 54-interacting transcriptional regulator [Polyangia bacterium]
MTVSITRLIAKDAAIFRQSGRGRFIVIRGPDRGDSVVVGPSPITLGSGLASDVRLSDPTISRRHLSVTPAESGVVVRDLGSTNGSFVGGARFQELLLGFGAEIQIGQTLLKYLPDEEHVDVTPTASERFGDMLGRDPKMRQVFGLLEDVAHSEATVLLEGETGTGKELLAEEIHRHSPRADRPFVVFDCAAQPKDLIESALFGHVRGAFTGAIADRKGAFVEADGGTLFLDEVGELAVEMQPVLLRALDKRTIRSVGGTGQRVVSVRVVAATHRDLRAEMATKRFREDLYYRLEVVRIHVPPLRERPADFALLVQHFVESYAKPPGLVARPEDIEQLARLPWPGNVRQLRNVIEHACAVSHGDELDLAEFLASALAPAPALGAIALDAPFKEAKARVVEEFERVYLKALLERHEGNLSAASRSADLDRKHLRELLRKHGLREETD